MTGGLKVRVGVLDEAAGVVEFLAENAIDVGSVRADLLLDGAAGDLRFLCVVLVDREAVADLADRMRRAWVDRPDLVKLTDRSALVPLPLGAVMLVFLDIPAIDAPL